MTMCWHCRQLIIPEDEQYDRPRSGHYGEYLCQACADEHYVECQSCNEYECACCAAIPCDVSRPRTYCLVCANERLTHCVSCDSWYRHTSQSDYCDSCAPEYWDDEDYDTDDDDACGLINSWDYTPYFEFHGKGPAYLGLELEVSVPYGNLYEAANAVINRNGSTTYLKGDSSIAGGGFEMVTHPCDHEFFRTEYDWMILDDLKELGCDGDGNGIHVHVSRDGFDSPSHVYRWMRLIYRNRQAVSAVARRNPSQWGSFTTHTGRQFKDFAKGSKRSSERYSAINVQNEETFEVRVFRASLNRREVMAALDLVAASVEYTRELTVPAIMNGGWTWDGFMAWAKDDERYAALVAESEALV